MATKTHNGLNYYFAHLCHEENKWKLNNKRFLLNLGNVIIGQYLSSNWFNCPMNQEKNMKFAVLGVENRKHIYNLIDILNSNYPNYNTHNFVEIFECSRPETEKLVEEKVDKRILFYGKKNTKNKLFIRFIYHNKLLLATLPEFELVQM
jgi:hypothetical protein